VNIMLLDKIADGRAANPRRMATLVALAVLLPLIAGCAGMAGAGDYSVAGDEKGGKIVGGVGEGRTAGAMRAVNAHCAKYGKKPFITQMESPAQGGLMAFVCLDR
jgi:hypothetical protein